MAGTHQNSVIGPTAVSDPVLNLPNIGEMVFCASVYRAQPCARTDAAETLTINNLQACCSCRCTSRHHQRW